MTRSQYCSRSCTTLGTTVCCTGSAAEQRARTWSGRRSGLSEGRLGGSIGPAPPAAWGPCTSPCCSDCSIMLSPWKPEMGTKLTCGSRSTASAQLHVQPQGHGSPERSDMQQVEAIVVLSQLKQYRAQAWQSLCSQKLAKIAVRHAAKDAARGCSSMRRHGQTRRRTLAGL